MHTGGSCKCLLVPENDGYCRCVLMVYFEAAAPVGGDADGGAGFTERSSRRRVIGVTGSGCIRAPAAAEAAAAAAASWSVSPVAIRRHWRLPPGRAPAADAVQW